MTEYKHLVWRPHPWKKQLSFRGRSLTARQVVGAMYANSWWEEEAAEQYGLPVEAVLEAVRYVEENGELLAAEAEHERGLLRAQGASI